MKRLKNKDYQLIVPPEIKPEPDKYEVLAAKVCALWFCSDIEFIMRGVRTTPDIRVLATGQEWEIKSVRGNSKHTIVNNLRKASRQSSHVVISLLRPTKITPEQAEARIRHFLSTEKTGICHVVLITKQKKVIDIVK